LLQTIDVVVELLGATIAFFQTAPLELGVVAFEEFLIGGTDGLHKGWAADADDDAAGREKLGTGCAYAGGMGLTLPAF
jgi:hypothetical protein